MMKRVEFEIDDDLVQEAIRRFHVADTREAVYLALKTLLAESDPADEQDDEYDEFSDLNAWQPRRSGNSG
jgi:Arc/MetJ family transcription regulator